MLKVVVVVFLLTFGLSMLVALAVVFLLRPQVHQVQVALQNILDNWPR